jgi:hypothetical protein
MTRRTTMTVLVVALAAALAACGQDGATSETGQGRERTAAEEASSLTKGSGDEESTTTQAPESSTTTAAPAPSTTESTPAPATPPPADDGGPNAGQRSGQPTRLAAPLGYTRSGGLAGQTTELTIQPDGSAVLSGSESARFDLTAAEMDTVANALAGVDFSQSAGGSGRPPGQPIPDAFHYQVTYDGHTARAQDTQVPSSLRPLLGALQSVIDAH